MVSALSPTTRIIAVIAGLLLIALVLELVRRRKLQERYIVVWVFTGVVLVACGAVPDIVRIVVNATSAHNPVVGLFEIVLVLFGVFALHTTTVISRLSEQVTRLAQELAVERARSQPRQEDDEI